MPKINSELNIYMKKQIYITTFVKLVRGCVKGLGIKKKVSNVCRKKSGNNS